jgi:hypothetical protein
VTNNLNQLNLGNREYKGKQLLYMGNGKSAYISHIGNASINGTRQLYLKNLLRVPLIRKNLMSVSQFAKDNNVYFEFHSTYCLVKDNLTDGFYCRVENIRGYTNLMPQVQENPNMKANGVIFLKLKMLKSMLKNLMLGTVN